MSSKKRRRKEKAAALASGEDQAPAKATPSRPSAAVQAQPEDPRAERMAQQVISVVGFALVGLLMGFLTGANFQVATAGSESALVQATWVGSALATQHADWGRGISAGLMGGLVGGSFGYSLFLSPGVMLLSWIGGGAGLAAGLATGLAFIGGVGWVSGFFAVLFGALKLKLGSGS